MTQVSLGPIFRFLFFFVIGLSLSSAVEPPPVFRGINGGVDFLRGFKGSVNPNASVAVCVLGMQRTFTSQYVLNRLKANVLDRLPADVFILMNPGWAGWTRPKEWVVMPEDSLFNSSIDSIIDSLKPVYSLVGKLPWTNMNTSKHCHKHGLENWFWTEKCLEQVSIYETLRGRRYDWIIRFRTDIVIQKPINFTFLSETKNASYVTYSHASSESGVDDCMYISGRDAAERSFRVVDLYRKCLPKNYFEERPYICKMKRANFPNCALRASLIMHGLQAPVVYRLHRVVVRACSTRVDHRGWRPPVCPKVEIGYCCVPSEDFDPANENKFDR